MRTTENPTTLRLGNFARNCPISNFKFQISDFKNAKSKKQNGILRSIYSFRILTLMFLAFTFPILFSGCKKQSEPEKETPKKEAVVKFPQIEGWKLGEVKTYIGEELYGPINGEADRYFPFGFEQAYFASYEKADAKGIVDIRIYQMDSPDNAYGIYTMYDVTSPYRDLIKNDVLASIISGSALDFVKSRYFVRISIHEMEANNDLLVSFGNSIAQVLEGKSQRPKMLELLPHDYIHGYSNLYFIRYFRKWETYKELNYQITENIFNLSKKTECVLAQVHMHSSRNPESEMLIVKYSDTEDMADVMENVRKYFSKDNFTSTTDENGWININIYKEHLWGLVAVENSFICAIFDVSNPEWAVEDFKESIENIRKSGN